MNEFNQTITKPRESILATNKVLKNTYLLLSITLFFSAAMAAVSMAINPPKMTGIITSVAAIAMLWFVIPRYEESSGIGGLVCVFIFTGLLGFGLGPVLNAYVGAGLEKAIVTALGGTAVIFLGLSGYALTTKKDFNFIGGFLFAGILVAFIAAIANIFLNITGLALAIDVVFILLMSGMILFETSRLVRGEETNYIRATVSLYVAIYNMFVSLLSLLGLAND